MPRRVIDFSMKEETKEKSMIRTKPNKIFLVLLLIVAAWFYWFQWRPTKIRKNCHQWIVDLPGRVEESLYWESDRAEYNSLYQSCLHREGLK